MTREEMLFELAKTEFCAIPTVCTMDMGIEFDFVCSEGAGTLFGVFGSWPMYRLRKVDKDKIEQFKAKVAKNKLTLEDLEGTDFYRLYNQCVASEIDIQSLFWNISKLPDIDEDYLWCICDIYEYEPCAEFFETKDDMIDSFQLNYCSEIQEWNDMEDEELETWLKRIHDENDLGGEIAYTYFTDGEEADKQGV